MDFKSVLIVDDSEADQFLTRSRIESFDPDIEIFQVMDGRQALDFLCQCENFPDIILLDINMPVMNGHEFLQEIEKQQYPVEVVMILSSSDNEYDKHQALQYACVKKYFTKPIDDWDLQEIKNLDLFAA